MAYKTLPLELRIKISEYAERMCCSIEVEHTGDFHILKFCTYDLCGRVTPHYAVCSRKSLQEAAEIALVQLTQIYYGDNHEYRQRQAEPARPDQIRT